MTEKWRDKAVAPVQIGGFLQIKRDRGKIVFQDQDREGNTVRNLTWTSISSRAYTLPLKKYFRNSFATLLTRELSPAQQGDLKLVFQFHRINADVPLEFCNLWNGNERAAPQRNISFQAGQQLLIALPQAAQAGNFCDAIPQRRSLCGDILPDPVGIPLLEGFTEIMM